MLQQRCNEASVIYDVYYQTQTKREYLFRIRTIQSGEHLQNKFRQSGVETIKDFQYSAYNKIITLNLQKLPQNIEEIIQSEQKLLQFIQSRMNDKRVANKTILVKQVPIPKKIIYVSKNILNIIGSVQKSKNNTRRDSSQTSNFINKQYTASQSETLLPNGNIQSSVFYGCDFNLILSMLSKSNASQKNKGDIGELVSLPFTCQKCPDGIYRRNYISQYQREIITNDCDDLYDVAKHKSVSIILGYIQPNKITQKIQQQFEIFKQHEFYKALSISNDFVDGASFSISSNIPSIDNSIILQYIGNKHLLIIVRQDKIGYDSDDIATMVNKGIISLCETIEKIKRFEGHEIDLIYTLAWSRKQEKGKKLVSPLFNLQIQNLVRTEIISYVKQHFDGQKFQLLMNRLHLSIFAENNLSDNVIKQSAGLYKVFSRQYPEYKENFMKVSDTLYQLSENIEFHRLCDTVEYEFFQPAVCYTKNNLRNLPIIRKYLQKIKIKPLRERMLKGLDVYEKFYYDQQISLSGSDVEESIISTTSSNDEFNSD